MTLRIAGIGGTGVVTVAQVVAVAAVIAGRHVRGMDQTGLAQKGGAVISDLRITAEPVAAGGRLARGECDLYLGADLLVAADESTLAVTDPDRTVAIVSTTKVPTGRMVIDTTATFPEVDAVTTKISDSVRSGTWLDARALSEQLFGSDQYANMLLVGAACQSGALPLPAAAIEQAIGLNGVAVEKNVQAFRRGRQLVADPAAFAAELGGEPGGEPAGSAGAGARRPGRLGACPPGGDPRGRADRLPGRGVRGRLPRRRRARPRGRGCRGAGIDRPGGSGRGEPAQAARLQGRVRGRPAVPGHRGRGPERFGAGARFSWQLHPPVLRALGMRRKITLGPWFAPAFRALYGDAPGEGHPA